MSVFSATPKAASGITIQVLLRSVHPASNELGLEFAIAVLPLIARGNLFNCVTMFSNLAIGRSEQVVEGHVFSAEAALADRQNEVAFAKNFVNSIVFYGHFLLS